MTIRRLSDREIIPCMRLRRLGAALCVVLASTVGAVIQAAPSHAASITCFGSSGCNGASPGSSCTDDESLVESLAVPQLGTLDLYQSASCQTAWAVLAVNPDTQIEDSSNPYQYIAEIFYEPPQGGPEQFNTTAPWGGTGASNILTTTMVPNGASFKACAGSPNGSADPFDEDPQGLGGVTEPPSSYYDVGACTLWH